MFQRLPILVVVLLTGSRADADNYETVVAPFLKQHCVRCHGAKKQEARLSLQKLTASVSRADARVWEAVLTQLSEGTMPPEDEPRPSVDQVTTVSK